MAHDLPGRLRHNLGLKVASVLLAVVVVLHVYTDRVHDAELWLPVEISGRPDSLALAAPPPARARVLFRGRGKELLKLRWRAPVIQIDLSGAAGGRFYHSLSAADVEIPATSKATAVAVLEPRLVTMELDRFGIRELPVALRFTGALPAGYRLRQARVEPGVVAVRGPSRLLPALDSLEVGPVDLRGLRGRAEGRFVVRPPSPEVVIAPPEVRVELDVDRLATRTLGRVRVKVLADSGLVGWAEPDPASLEASGTREATRALAAAGPGAVVVDARGLGPGVYELAARVDTMGGVILTPVPARFRVRLDAKAPERTGEGKRGTGDRGRRRSQVAGGTRR